MTNPLITNAIVAVVGIVVGIFLWRRGYKAGYTVMHKEHEAYRARNRDILDGLQKASRLPSAAPIAGDFPRPHSIEPPIKSGALWMCACGAAQMDDANARAHLTDYPYPPHRLTRHD